MLTDLNDKFPYNEDQLRVNSLNTFYKIFRGKLYSANKAEAVFQLKAYFQNSKKKREILAVAVNLGALISTVAADFLFGDEFKIRHTDPETEKRLTEYQIRDGLNQKLYESALLHSAVGYTAFQVRIGDDGKATTEEIPYNNYYPNFRNVILSGNPSEKIIASYFTKKDAKGKKITYIFKQIHFLEDKAGRIRNEVWQVKSSTRKQKTKKVLKDFFPEMEEEVITGLEYIPIFQVNNIKTVKERYGESDYVKILSLLEEVNDRITQISLQFVKHLNAKMSAPRGNANLDGKGNVKSENTEVFFVDAGDEAPRYIEYTNQLIEEAFKHIESIIDKISAQSQTPKMFLGVGEKGGVEKVEALRIRMLPLIKKTTRNRNSYIPLITRILETVASFDNFDLDLSGLSFEFNDGIPQDKMMKSKSLETGILSGFISKRTATKEFNNIEGEELEEELKLIGEDEQIPEFNL